MTVTAYGLNQGSILACLFLFFVSGQLGAQTESAGQSDAPSRPLTQRRIVDPKKFPPKPPLPARIVLAPFRSLALKTNRMLTNLEETKMLERVRIILSNPNIHPLFGGLGDGSGFGGGAYLSTADRLSQKVTLFGSAHLTGKFYLESIAGLRATPAPESLKGFSLDVTTRYRLRPQEDFFGIGPDSSRRQRTNYHLQERGVGVTASFRLGQWVRIGAGVDYSSNRVFRGKDRRFPATQTLFASNHLPGLAEGAALLGTSAFAELEARDEPGNPHAGAYVRAEVTTNDSVGRGDFGFVNYLLDARGYIPLGTKRRVLALRLLGDFNDRKGGSEIPFFRLPRLGDTQTLRGYDTFRFHGRSAISANVEYRYDLVQGITAVAFTDLGQVFNRRSEFNMNNLHATFGGGLQFASKKSVALRILVGKSGEGARFFFSFGPTF